MSRHDASALPQRPSAKPQLLVAIAESAEEGAKAKRRSSLPPLAVRRKRPAADDHRTHSKLHKATWQHRIYTKAVLPLLLPLVGRIEPHHLRNKRWDLAAVSSLFITPCL